MATESLVFDILARDGASPSFVKVGEAAKVAAGDLKDLSDKLKAIDGKSAKARVGLDGDKETGAELDRLDAKLITLGKRIANPNIKLEGMLRARAELTGVELALDRIDGRHATATVEVNTKGGLLSRLGGVFGGGGEAGAGGGGIGGALLAGGGIGGALIGAGLVPGAVGLGAGGLAGLGVVGGGLLGAAAGKKALDADLANIRSITTKLKAAVGQQKKELSKDLRDAQKQYAKDSRFYAPFTGLQESITSLAKIFLVALRPVIGPVTQLIKQFGGELKTLQPQFTALFQASLPFLKSFATVMLQLADVLLPAFTTILNQMVKSGALKIMTQGLITLVNGLGTFITNLGPGLQASAVIFAKLATFVGRLLGFLGEAFTVVAKILTFNVPAAAKKGFDAVIASAKAFWHDIAAVFDTVRHFIAASWDATWSDTKKIVTSGISAVVGFFKALPGKVVGALFGLGHSLYAFAHSALQDFWNGFKAVGGALLSWLGGFVGRIIGLVKKLLGIGSPSTVFHEIGVNLMQGLARGIRASAHHAANAARGAATSAVTSSALGGDEATNMRLARRIFPWGAGQWQSFFNLTMRESGFNRFARNASSGAYGIPQALPPSKLPFAGQAAGGSHAGPQLSWMFNYIAQRYGTPAGAWAHELQFGWYDGKPGWSRFLPPGLSLALNTTGRPEMVGPARGNGVTGIRLTIDTGNGQIDRALANSIRATVNADGGGDVQVALGGSY